MAAKETPQQAQDRMIRQEMDAKLKMQQNAEGASRATQVFQDKKEQNLIEWQLDFSPELKQIERMLRGQVLVFDKKLNKEIWQDPEDKAMILLNEQGVQEVLKIMRSYLNKNLVLSWYTEEQIKIRVSQFGKSFARLLLYNAKQYGLDTAYKQAHYEMIVMNMLNMVEAAYYRALNGNEKKSLTTARTVHQSEPLGREGAYPGGMNVGGSGFKWYNPTTWS